MPSRFSFLFSPLPFLATIQPCFQHVQFTSSSFPPHFSLVSIPQLFSPSSFRSFPSSLPSPSIALSPQSHFQERSAGPFVIIISCSSHTADTHSMQIIKHRPTSAIGDPQFDVFSLPASLQTLASAAVVPNSDQFGVGQFTRLHHEMHQFVLTPYSC